MKATNKKCKHLKKMDGYLIGNCIIKANKSQKQTKIYKCTMIEDVDIGYAFENTLAREMFYVLDKNSISEGMVRRTNLT